MSDAMRDDTHTPSAFDVTEATTVLRRTPHVLHALFTELDPAWMHVNEGDDTWTARDVVAHLADLEDTDWMVRVNHILAERDGSAFGHIDRVRFREVFAGATVAQLLDAFAQRRARNLGDLDQLKLSAAQLATPGVHPSLGPVTLEMLLATWVVHDFTHIAQISRVMAKRYDRAVGPWRAFLSVLTR